MKKLYTINELLNILEIDLSVHKDILAELSIGDFEDLTNHLKQEQLAFLERRANKKYHDKNLCEE